MLKEYLSNLANAFRSKLGISDKINAQSFIDKIDEVYDKGYQKGKSEGGDSWYDAFWDRYQQNGTRTDYQQAFMRVGWSGTAFRPKYNMNVTNGRYFLYAAGVRADPIDLIALEEAGLIIDFSKSTNMEAAFSQAPALDTVGTIDLSNFSGNLNSPFAGSRYLQKIKLLKVTDKITQYQNAFKDCDALVDIEFDGVISADISFSESPLNKSSIVSIVEHLSGTTSGKILTLKKTAVNTAFGINVDDLSTWPEGSEFYTLRHSKGDWTFTYA